MPFISVLTSGIENPASAIPLILIAIVLAFLISIIALRFERRLRKQRWQGSSQADSDHSGSSLPLQNQKRYSAYLKADFHPRSWLSKFSKISVKHLLLMSLFYHAIGIGLGSAGTILIAYLDPSYEEPVIAFSLFDALAAGPIEESIAFGIPFYASGNHYLVLVTGSLWALAHVLNTDTYNISSLAYGNVLFAMPHIFLSLRTWASGKGWFAIIFHSAWNGMAFGMSCGVGEIPCVAFGSGGLPIFAGISYLLGTIIATEVLLLIAYLLYYRRTRKEIADPRASPPIIPQIAIINSGSYGASSSLLSRVIRPTMLWYLLPLLLGVVDGLLAIVGGLIVYFKLRKQDAKMARNGTLNTTV